VPLNPGKNITVIAEVIAMNHLLRYSGVNPAEAFNQRLITRMKAQQAATAEALASAAVGDGGGAGARLGAGGYRAPDADVRRYLQEDDE
jgi:HPr kinase/phosphorylase